MVNFGGKRTLASDYSWAPMRTFALRKIKNYPPIELRAEAAKMSRVRRDG